MTYIENVFICLSVPLLLSLLFVKGTLRRYTLFLCIGMGICMVSAYVNSFFMELYQVDGVTAAIEISPVCEEILKLVPLLFLSLSLSRNRRKSHRPPYPLPSALPPLKMCATCRKTEPGISRSF